LSSAVARARSAAPHPAEHARAHQNIGEGVELGDQVIGLEHQAKEPAAASGELTEGEPMGGFGAPEKLTAVGPVEPGENVEQRAFARAGLAPDGDGLAGTDGKIHALQHGQRAVAARVGFAHADRAQDWRRVTHCAGPPRVATGRRAMPG
jgi:hypothetical protein